MNILIIGGSNFIGWKLVEMFGETEHDITVVNRVNHSRNYPKNAVHHIADRNDYAKMSEIVKGKNFDAVFDMCGFVADDMKDTAELFGGHTKKYIFISTAATYLEPLEMPIREDFTQGAHAVWGKYGSGKLACEQVLLAAHENSDFPAVIVRPSYVYGAGNSIDRETFLFDRIVKGRKILVPGDGEAVIQLGEVTDLCRALILLAEKSGGQGESYNISGNEFVTLNSLVRLVAKIIGKDYQTVHINPKDFGMTDRDIFPFNNISYVTSCEKFSREFDWSPEISLSDGLNSAYNEWNNSAEKLPTNYDEEDKILARLEKLGLM